MKVAWIQDMDPFTDAGGAQQTDKSHILFGIRNGHEVEVILKDQFYDDNIDLTVVSNAQSFSTEFLNSLRIPYVIFLHDYWGLCRYRLFYPMQDKCRSCYLKDRFLLFLQNSALIIWLSPLHRESWLFTYPELKEHKHTIIPSAINVDLFYNLEQERHGVLAINAGLKFKGVSRFREWAEEHRDVNIDLVGSIDELLPNNVHSINFVPPLKMNGLYNKYQKFIHLPTTPQPFERTVAEAYLAGCEIIGNRNIGALSFPWFTDREMVRICLQTVNKQFWDCLKRVI